MELKRQWAVAKARKETMMTRWVKAQLGLGEVLLVVLPEEEKRDLKENE